MINENIVWREVYHILNLTRSHIAHHGDISILDNYNLECPNYSSTSKSSPPERIQTSETN